MSNSGHPKDSGKRRGLMLVLSGANLTDEANIIEYGVNGALGEYKQFGRQFYFGINFVY